MKDEISLELLEGTRNLMKFASLKKGDNLLIHVDRLNDDPVLVQAMVIAGEEKGANVAVLKTREWHKQVGAPYKIVGAALLGADIIISQGNSLYRRTYSVRKALWEHGINLVYNEALRVESMADAYGRFPSDLLFAICEKVLSIVEKGKMLRVTQKKGTDVSMGINPRRITGTFWKQLRPGEASSFPGGLFGITPSSPANGVICAELINPGSDPPSVLLKDVIKITIENGWATDIGGEHADWLIELLKTDENTRNFAECMWGTHPKAEPFGFTTDHPTTWFRSLHGRSDMLHFALGCGIGGGHPISKVHCDFYIHNPTVYVDGEILIDNGHLVIYDDPEIRTLAKKYGNPDQLLAIAPLPPGMLL